MVMVMSVDKRDLTMEDSDIVNPDLLVGRAKRGREGDAVGSLVFQNNMNKVQLQMKHFCWISVNDHWHNTVKGTDTAHLNSNIGYRML